MEKTCLVCGAIFTKPSTRSVRDWNERAKYCGPKCRAEARRGKPSWNRGLTHDTDPRVARPWLGKALPAETIAAMRAGYAEKAPRGKDNPNWKGQDAGYPAFHQWARKYFTKTGRCEICDREARTHWHLRQKGELSREREDWQELCPSCHKHVDLGHTFSWERTLVWR